MSFGGSSYFCIVGHANETPPNATYWGVTSIPAMVGATAGSAGTAGLVPAPAAGDNSKFFAGDGTYKYALSDYEEGTWTPSVGGTATYTYQVGRYVKIGKMVYISMNMRVNAIGTGSTHTISGLPFSSISLVGGFFAYYAFLSQAVISLAGEPSGTSLYITSTLGAATQQDLNAVIGNGTWIRCSFTYMTVSAERTTGFQRFPISTILVPYFQHNGGGYGYENAG
ncbi:MAG: hypothetical protein H7829_03325 [Magnetococcus sp. THC-1_WYH]